MPGNIKLGVLVALRTWHEQQCSNLPPQKQNKKKPFPPYSKRREIIPPYSKRREIMLSFWSDYTGEAKSHVKRKNQDGMNDL
jgi:hypothetical protein